jgi:hypothetical protein
MAPRHVALGITLALLLTAPPCVAATEVASPMTVTHINVQATNPLIARVESEVKSFVLDSAVAFAMNLQSVNSTPPPPGYDRYPNVEVLDDIPDYADLWGFTEPAATPGGRCIVHIKRLRQATASKSGGWIEVLEEVGLPRLLRHEAGHCWGLAHSDIEHQDTWLPVADQKSFAELAHRQWIAIKNGGDLSTVNDVVLPDDPRRLAEMAITYAAIAETCPQEGLTQKRGSHGGKRSLTRVAD